jgi:hypothetical protein
MVATGTSSRDGSVTLPAVADQVGRLHVVVRVRPALSERDDVVDGPRQLVPTWRVTRDRLIAQTAHPPVAVEHDAGNDLLDPAGALLARDPRQLMRKALRAPFGS